VTQREPSATPPPVPPRTPKRSSARPGVERINASLDKRLAALARAHGLSWSTALARGLAEMLLERGIELPRNPPLRATR
jgi:hypothetical protein